MDNAAKPSKEQRRDRLDEQQRRNAHPPRQDGVRSAEEASCANGVCEVTWKPKRTAA